MTVKPSLQHQFALEKDIQRGDVAPYSNMGPHSFVFDAFPNRFIVLGFFRPEEDSIADAALKELQDNGRLVDDGKAVFFCIFSDPADEAQQARLREFSAIRFLCDPRKEMMRAYGAEIARRWIVITPMLRVTDVIPFRADGADRRQLMEWLEKLAPPSDQLGFEPPAPILLLSDVFEPELCRHLVDLFDRNGGKESGFMQEADGKSIERHDPLWKRRKDLMLADPALSRAVRSRIGRRVAPEIRKAYHFNASRTERDLIACYEAGTGGHFGPHRDDTDKTTVHRKFAVSINLNSEFAGGEVSFPEYGSRGYKAPAGAAVVFSGSILHGVSRVTRGRRYVFLSFLFDEEGEKTRLANLQFLAVRPNAV
jgi:hypothetical protein